MGLLGKKHVLGDEVGIALLDKPLHLFGRIGELPVPGQHVDAEQVGDLDHVGALGDHGGIGALPEIAAVKVQGRADRRAGAQPP